ncbi:MAG: riboflavin synthase [Pseudomonadota bacterium]|nr:MAG: riboflavin synthase [Pseudomonadota bacterium]
MFTGIVQAIGQVSEIEPGQDGRRIVVRCPPLHPDRWQIGDSVAVAGCCLTAVALAPDSFAAELSAETLARSSLGGLNQGDPVNLEPALAVGERLGGHLVSGHIDGLAEVADRRDRDGHARLRCRVPAPLARFLVVKGSVTVDGVSLTVNAVDGSEFEVNCIPHTLGSTTLGRLRTGDPVNLEVDLVARYLDRLLQQRGADEL